MSQYSWDQIVATIESWLDPDEYTSKVTDVSFASTLLQWRLHCVCPSVTLNLQSREANKLINASKTCDKLSILADKMNAHALEYYAISTSAPI